MLGVTVCLPDGSSCQTIGDLLLETGSTGLRIFRQALHGAFEPAAVDGGQLAECITYGDGTSDWGPVVAARVVLGGEPPVVLPMQVIDPAFAAVPSSCASPERSPAAAGYDGVLGVGNFAQDCGAACAHDPRNGIYFACTGTSCSETALPVASQVQNPVALLPGDGNGFVLTLPAAPQGRAASLEGQLVLGIGTRANNAPGSVTRYALDANGGMSTVVAGTSYPSSFLDSGSNGYFFAAPPASPIPVCQPPLDTWYCPGAPLALQATNAGSGGAPAAPVGFQLESFLAFSRSPDAVSSAIGGPAPAAAGFDWGLPFFLGRTVYVGLEGASSPLGVGPYWAY